MAVGSSSDRSIGVGFVAAPVRIPLEDKVKAEVEVERRSETADQQTRLLRE